MNINEQFVINKCYTENVQDKKLKTETICENITYSMMEIKII